MFLSQLLDHRAVGLAAHTNVSHLVVLLHICLTMSLQSQHFPPLLLQLQDNCAQGQHLTRAHRKRPGRLKNMSDNMLHLLRSHPCTNIALAFVLARILNTMKQRLTREDQCTFSNQRYFTSEAEARVWLHIHKSTSKLCSIGMKAQRSVLSTQYSVLSAHQSSHNIYLALISTDRLVIASLHNDVSPMTAQ
jgi:hypothetical protein